MFLEIDVKLAHTCTHISDVVTYLLSDIFFSHNDSLHGCMPFSLGWICISVRRFCSTNLVDDMMGLINSYELPPEYIKIEITETIIIENFSKVRHVMEQVMHRRLSFYLDDSGSGYANIARYISLPF